MDERRRALELALPAFLAAGIDPVEHVRELLELAGFLLLEDGLRDRFSAAPQSTG